MIIFEILDTSNNTFSRINKVYSDFTGTKSVDGSLESVNISLLLPTDIPITQYTPARLRLNPSLNFTMVIAEDYPTLSVRGANRFYKHSLILLENIAITDKIYVHGLSLTNKNDTLKTQIEKVFINLFLLEEDEKPIFSLSERLITKLGNIPGEKFRFNDLTTLHEVLDEMLSIINCRAKINDITNINAFEIDYVDLNVRNLLINFDNEKCIYDEEFNESNIYGANIETVSQNVETPYPVIEGWNTFKSASGQLTTDNVTVMTNFAIKDIINFTVKFRVSAKTTITDFNGNTSTTFAEWDETLDITDYVVDSDTYALLDVKGLDHLTQQIAIPYERGNNSFAASGTNKRFLFFNVDKFTQLITVAFKKKYTTALITVELVKIQSDLVSIPYKITYDAYLETRSKISKPGIYSKYNLMFSTTDNQSNQFIDSTRLGKNLYNKISQIGNNVKIKDIIHNNIMELYNLFDYTNDNYVIYKINYNIQKSGKVNVRYFLSYNYVNINTRIAVHREKEIYQIPLASRKSSILIKHYIMVDFTRITNDEDVLLNNNGIKLLLGSYNGDYSYSIKKMLLNTYSNGQEYGLYELDCSKWAYGNTIYVKSVCFDNYSVGPSVNTWSLGGWKISLNPYCNTTTGEFDSFQVIMTTDKRVPDDLPSLVAQSKMVPKTYLTFYNDSAITSIFKRYKFIKDRESQIEFIFCFEVIPSSNNFNTIIIGQYLTENNTIISDNTKPFKDSKIWISKERYQPAENLFAKGDLLEAAEVVVDTVEGDNIKVQYIGSIDSEYVSYAIVSSDNQLIMAVNDITTINKYIYFNQSKTKK